MTEDTMHSQLIGKTILLGNTILDRHGKVSEQKQMHGVVVVANEEGIKIELPSRDYFYLPPGFGAICPAKPGEYRLRSTGEVVVNPDYLTEWTVYASSEELSD